MKNYLFPYAGFEPRAKRPKKIKLARRVYKKDRSGDFILSYQPSGFTPEQYDKLPLMPGSLKKLMLEICLDLKVTPNDVVSPKKVKSLLTARKIFVKRARDELNASFPRIGMCLNRDHTTCVYAYHGRTNRSTLTQLKPHSGHEVVENLVAQIPSQGLRIQPIEQRPTRYRLQLSYHKPASFYSSKG